MKVIHWGHKMVVHSGWAMVEQLADQKVLMKVELSVNLTAENLVGK